MNRINDLKKKLKNNKTVIGTWSSLSSANVIDVIGTTNLDFVVIDMEHGSMSFETTENMVRAAESANISPIIRAGDNDEQHLLRILETGVQSIMVPHINSAKDAEKVVNACKYYPIGKRGLSPYTRIHNYTHENIAESMELANENTMIGILVEGQNGLDNLSEIAKVPGLNLIYIGLFDICQSVGLPGQLTHPKVLNELKRCQNIIQSNDIAAGSMAKDISYAETLYNYKYQFIAYINDAAAIKNFYKEFLSGFMKR